MNCLLKRSIAPGLLDGPDSRGTVSSFPFRTGKREIACARRKVE